VLWALGQPIALIGLVLGFLLAVLIRAVTQHALASRGRMSWGKERRFDPRRDIDIFGAVAAALGGTGWGRRAPAGPDGRPRASVLLAGPAAVLIASQLAFLAFRLAGDPLLLQLHTASSVLHGVPGDAVSQLLLSIAVSLLCFGLLALVPLPPLDGWGLLAGRAGPRPSPGFARAQHWLDEQNIGVVILLVGLIIPLVGGPLFLFLLDVVTAPVFLAWS
jgi:hypothetical protein